MEASGQVASAAGQVASSSQSLAEGSSEQAAAIEETSSSLEEMASMTRQNAENAGQANILMGEANNVISKANATMQHLTTSMKEITTASEETQKIIKTIDEIAFQTNLLALNAAVEAARAGEAGAGFAVVADEVRNLALRAAEAARNTADLIEGTVKKIKEGAQIVAKTNDEFTEVTSGVTKSGKLIEEIAAASHEQAQGIGQVNQAVSQMDKVVQQNAATAEESASASEEMNVQAEQMKEFVMELANLVGGNGKKVSAGHGAPPEPRQDKQTPGMEAAPPARTTPARSGNGKHSEKGNGNGNGHTPHRSQDMRAEQLIPFDKDDFSDF
jgi:methyl-accepting chemotaxis protein